MITATADHENIRNVIALYSQALDEKQWQWMAQVMTPDISLEYPPPLGIYKGVPACQAGVKKAISHLATCHELTTQSIKLTGPKTASAKTYCTASHYDGDKYFRAHSRYDDELVKDVFSGELAWRIKRRVVTVLGIPQGDWTLLH